MHTHKHVKFEPLNDPQAERQVVHHFLQTIRHKIAGNKAQGIKMRQSLRGDLGCFSFKKKNLRQNYQQEHNDL